MHILEIVGGTLLSIILFAVLGSRSTVKPTEEKGPMPKRHGGFGPVHGGKS
jgi:hypothetical protein